MKKNLFTIHAKRKNAFYNRYANANKFSITFIVNGENAMHEKIAELKKAGLEIESIYNNIGEKIKF